MLVPNVKDLSSIIFIDVKDNMSSNKLTISKTTDINKLLRIFKDSQRTNQESISEFPNKEEFTVVLFKFKTEGESFRSIYKENNNIYIDQPFHGIFRIMSQDIDILNRIRKYGNEENFNIPAKDILKYNFKE